MAACRKPAELIVDAGRSESPVAVGMVDVKDMAGINKRYGYAAGNKVLRRTGNLIGRLVRNEDLTARYGGQSFCVVMPETTHDDAVIVMRRIVNIIAMTELGVISDQPPVSIRLRLGTVMLENGDNAESLLARALEKAVSFAHESLLRVILGISTHHAY